MAWDQPPASPVYVAAVAIDRPWREPEIEHLLRLSDLPAVLSLPPGIYRTVVTAKGSSVSYGDPIKLETGHTAHVDHIISRLVGVTGQITSRRGEPIANARIATLRAWLQGIALELSPVAEDLRRNDIASLTDRDGRFSILLHPDGSVPLWIEAKAFAPRFLPAARANEDRTLGTISLEDGASLSPTWKSELLRAALGDRLDEYRLSLTSESAGLSAIGIGPRGLAALWERRLLGEPRGWDSLPAGTYRIMLRGTRQGAHSITPMLLATKELLPGDEVKVAIGTEIVARFGPSGRDPQATRRPDSPSYLVLRAPGAGSLGLETPIVVSRIEAGAVQPAAWRHDRKTSGGDLRIEILDACRRNVRYAVTAPKLAGMTAEGPTCSDGGRTQTLHLHPAASVSGRLAPPPGHRMPRAIAIEATGCPKPQQALSASPWSTLIAPVSALGSFTVSAPLDCRGVSLGVAYFVRTPIALAGKEPGDRIDLGKVSLRAGGSALLRLVSASSGEPISGSSVWTIAATDDTSPAPKKSSGSVALLPGALSDEQGWVRLYGLPGGNHLFAVSRPDGPAFWSAPYTIIPNDEIVVDPLVVGPPAQLEVRLDLGARLAQRDSARFAVAARSLVHPPRPDSLIEIEGGASALFSLEPGRWRLEAMVRLAPDQLALPAASDEIEVHPGLNFSDLKIEKTLFEGEVISAAGGAAGQLMIRHSDRHRGANDLVSVRIGEDGRFEVLLAPGRYDAMVSLFGTGIDRATVADVAFLDPSSLIEIHLPTASISGIVVDSEGRPIPQARVSLQSFRSRKGASAPRPSLRSTQAKNGTFTFRSCLEGEHIVWARAPSGQSARQVIELVAGEAKDAVRLGILEEKTATVLLLDESGMPVTSAAVWLSFSLTSSRDGGGWTVRSRTDPLGRLQVDVPARAFGQLCNLLIRTDTIVDARRLPLRGESSVGLTSLGAQVMISFRAERWDPLAGIALYLARSDGAYVPLSLVSAPIAAAKDGCRKATVARLAVGRWQLIGVRSRFEEALVRSGNALVLPALASVSIEAGHPVEVALDECDESRRVEQ